MTMTAVAYMWHDDSSPYRVQPLIMRMRLEPPPFNTGRRPGYLPIARREHAPNWAVCHPDRKHCCRGYCKACYANLNRAGMFKLYPALRLRPA